MKINYRYFFLCFLIACFQTQAQEKNSGNDSVKVYKKIENYSQKSNFNKFIYRLLFKAKRSETRSQKNIREHFRSEKSVPV